MLAQEKAPPTPQTQRGKELFVRSPKGVACGTCHTMAGYGTAVGPDLKLLASLAMPRGLVTAIKMSMTETVQEVKITKGATFPGILKEKTGDSMAIWDLSQMPPKLMTFPAAEVSLKRNEKWKHPPTAAGYTNQELADIVGFLRWAATGERNEVTVEQIAVSQ